MCSMIKTFECEWYGRSGSENTWKLLLTIKKYHLLKNMFLVLQNLSSFDRHTPIDDSGGRHVLKFKLRYYIYISRFNNYELGISIRTQTV